MLLPLLFLSLMCVDSFGNFANRDYVPKIHNPIVYGSDEDSVIVLNVSTFDNMVFGQNHVMLVQYYADWCGHSRAFAPIYRSFAASVANWFELVVVTAINCGGNEFNEKCRNHRINSVPSLKYFPLNSKYLIDAIPFERSTLFPSVMRDRLANMLLDEYNRLHHPHWPLFDYIGNDTTYSDDLWLGSDNSVNYLAIIFEEIESVGAQFLLDMHNQRHVITARRAMSTTKLAENIRLTVYPIIVIFRKTQEYEKYMDSIFLIEDLQLEPDIIGKIHYNKYNSQSAITEIQSILQSQSIDRLISLQNTSSITDDDTDSLHSKLDVEKTIAQSNAMVISSYKLLIILLLLMISGYMLIN